MAFGYHLPVSWLSSFLLFVVQATLSCNEVSYTDVDTCSIYICFKGSLDIAACCLSAHGVCTSLQY